MTALDNPLLTVTDEQRDQADIARHVLGNLSVPTREDDFARIFTQAANDGAVLPSGKLHRDVANVPKVLASLEKAGLVKRFSGHATHAELNAAAAADEDTIDDPDSGDSPHAKGAYHQEGTRGEAWARSFDDAGLAPSGDYWVMTKLGFRSLTGHDQGWKNPDNEPTDDEQEDA